MRAEVNDPHILDAIETLDAKKAMERLRGELNGHLEEMKRIVGRYCRESKKTEIGNLLNSIMRCSFDMGYAKHQLFIREKNGSRRN
jgi:hypothetical protein